MQAVTADTVRALSRSGRLRTRASAWKRKRSFIVHLPPNFVARGFQRHADLDAKADGRGYGVPHPNGSERFGKRFLTWNAGDSRDYTKDENVDNVSFTPAILAELARDFRLDPTRVHATGHSSVAMTA